MTAGGPSLQTCTEHQGSSNAPWPVTGATSSALSPRSSSQRQNQTSLKLWKGFVSAK